MGGGSAGVDYGASAFIITGIPNPLACQSGGHAGFDSWLRCTSPSFGFPLCDPPCAWLCSLFTLTPPPTPPPPARARADSPVRPFRLRRSWKCTLQGFGRVYFALVEFALVTAVTLTCYIMIVKRNFSIQEARDTRCWSWCSVVRLVALRVRRNAPCSVKKIYRSGMGVVLAPCALHARGFSRLPIMTCVGATKGCSLNMNWPRAKL